MARSFLPRLVALTLVWLFATAALTFAAGDRLASSPAPATAPTVATTPQVQILTVPDVRNQPYVFAKGALQDAGFAWVLSGSVKGYAANKVVGQVPAPGTRVVDTGAPTIVLQLARGTYAQSGLPEQSSPYPGTKLKLATPAAPAAAAPATAKPKAKPRPAAATPAKKTTVRTTPKAKPKPKPAPAKVPKPRPAAFTGPGTRPEPQNELPLPLRAERLRAWLAQRPKPTDANVRYWLFQHAWIVDGARAGWWHGADALQTLIRADQTVWDLWGIGARSQAIARHALSEVEARSK
jgi:hypothetical protein